MNKISLVKKLVLMFSVVFFASCDKEFNTIGSEIVGENYFNLDRHVFEGVTAYDTITGPVQSNNMALNSLGIYNDPVFGVSTSHFVTQAELPNEDITINGHASIDSVWVYVPYFSHLKSTNTDGTRVYELDSVYGGDAEFRLKVYENGYYLRSYDPDDSNGIQRFFSDDKSKVETNLLGADGTGNSIPNGQYLNNSTDAAENVQFSFSPAEKIIYKTNGSGLYVDATGAVLSPADQLIVSKRVIKERFTPGIWLNLNKEYFTKKILQAPAQALDNDNAFKSYFRGLYFQAEAITAGQGALAMLDFSKSYIKMTYNMDNVANSTTPTAIRLKKTLTLKLRGNTINFFDNSYTLPANPERLHLKGGNGSVAYINVFGETDANANGVPDELDQLKANNWLINEASLTFYIDNVAMGQDGQKEPNRLYLFDAKNKKPIIDYFLDGTTSSDPKKNKRGLGGIIEKEASTDKGIKYKIRLTEYLKNCIKNDSTNFKLGVAVTESINTITNAYLKPVAGQRPSRVVPVGSVMNPLGTVLHSPTSTDSDKKLKLEIYYTKPD